MGLDKSWRGTETKVGVGLTPKQAWVSNESWCGIERYQYNHILLYMPEGLTRTYFSRHCPINNKILCKLLTVPTELNFAGNFPLFSNCYPFKEKVSIYVVLSASCPQNVKVHLMVSEKVIGKLDSSGFGSGKSTNISGHCILQYRASPSLPV